MKKIIKKTNATKQRYSDFSELTKNELIQIRGGEIPPSEYIDEKEITEKR